MKNLTGVNIYVFQICRLSQKRSMNIDYHFQTMKFWSFITTVDVSNLWIQVIFSAPENIIAWKRSKMHSQNLIDCYWAPLVFFFLLPKVSIPKIPSAGKKLSQEINTVGSFWFAFSGIHINLPDWPIKFRLQKYVEINTCYRAG